MKKMINKFMVAAISLATLLITGSAWAAATAPVAVWDGFSGDNLTRKAGNNVLKLDLNGNEVNADGSVTVGNNNGISFLIYDSTGTTVQKWQGLSVMALVSNCPAIDYPSLIALHCQNGTASLRNIVGLSALSDGKVRELWGGSTYVANSGGSSSSVAGDVPSGDSMVTIGVSWRRGGTAANRLLISNGHIYTTGLGSTQAACDLDGAYIGGYELDKGHYGNVNNWTRLGDSVIATGMKIYAIAVFNDEITSATATAFSMNKWIGGGDNNWSTAANWSKGTVPASGDAAIIPEGAVVTVDGTIASGVTVQGSGTAIYDNKLPGNEKTSYQATAWTGTVWIKNLTNSAQRQVNEFGNAESTVKFTNVTGWMNTQSFAGTFELEDGPNGEVAWTQADGGNGQSYTFAKVKGSGKYYAKWNKTASTATIYLVDASEYSGSIQLDNGALGIMIGSNTGCEKTKITVANNSAVQIAAGKTWTAAGGIVINGTVVAGVSTTAPFASTVTGSGEIVFDGAGSTANTMPAAINGKLGGDWSGVVTLRNFGVNNGKQINLANFGAKVKLNGIDGYLSTYSNGSYAGELILEDYVKSDGTVQYAWTQNNGGSGTHTTIAKLSGSGTLYGNAGATQWFRFTDGSEFRGTINFPNTNTDATKKRSVVFGTSNGVAGNLVVNANETATIAEGKTWTFPVGATIDGTLVGNGTLAIATTFNANSTLDLSGRTATTALVTGNLTLNDNMTIKLPANATSPYALASGTITATAGDRILTIGDWTGIAKVSFANGEMTFTKIGNGTEADPYVVSTEADLNEYAAKAPSDGSEITYVKVVTPTDSFAVYLANPFEVPTAHPVSLIIAETLSFVGDYAIIVPTGATLYLSSPNDRSIPGVKNAGMLYADNVFFLAGDWSSSGVSLYTTDGGRSEICGGIIEDKKVVDAGSTIALGGNVTFGDAADANTINLADGTTQVVAKDSNDVAYAGPALKLVYAEALGQGQTLVSGILSDTVKAKFSFFVGETEVTDTLNYNAEAGTITTSTLNARVVRNGGDSEMFEDLPAALAELVATDTGVTITLLANYENSETELVAACDIAIASEHTLTAKFDLANGKAISYPASATITFVQESGYRLITNADGSRSVKLDGATAYTWTGAIDNVWAKDGNWSPVVGYPGLYAGDTATFPNTAAESVIALPEDEVTIATLTGAFKIALDGVEKPTASAPVTLIVCNASGATVTPETEVEGYYLKTDATGLTYHSNLEFLRYGYAFEDNVNKETAASESIDITNVIAYEAGVRTKALAFRTSKNHGTGFGFGGGDFTIFAVIKAPTDANRCIFSLGGQKGTTGMIGLRTTGANSVAVFTKDGTDLMTVSVEDSATMFHYYALKYDSVANTIALSVDGGAFSDPVAYTSGTGGQFQFGGIHGGEISGKAENANNGAIDEFQLYTKKLAVEQIQTLGAAFEPNTWKGESGGSWATASNWSYNEVPAESAFVVIPTGDTAEAYKIVLATGATVSLGSVKITGAATSFEFENGEVTMGALKSSVDILVGANDTLIFPNRKESITLADNKVIKGSGRVVMVGNGLANTLDLLSAQFTGVRDANNWTGTLEFRDWCGMSNANYAKYGNFYGNANSTICFNGFKGHVYATDFEAIKAYEIGEDGAEFTGQFARGNIGFLGDLIGSGDLMLSLTGNDAKNGYLRFVGDSSAYKGSFSFAESNAFPISLIPSTSTTMPLAEFSQRMIILAVEAGAWTVNGDIEVIAGASFDDAKKPTVNGKIKFDSAVAVTLAEAIPAEGSLIINNTVLKPGMVYTAPITGTAGGVEIGAGYHPVVTETGVVVKLAEVAEWNNETILIEGVKTIDAATVAGKCTVKGQSEGAKALISSISVGENASLTLDGVTVEVEDLNVFPQSIKLVNGAKLVVNDTMTMVQLAANETLEMEAGTQYTIYNVPNFNASSTIKITNAAKLQPGNYLLMDWSNWPNPDLMGYGMPQLNVEGYTGAEGSIRIIPEVYKLWLQVRSVEEMARPALTIEPIGDSITEGLNNAGENGSAGGKGKNYRIPLINKLLLAGYNVKSVGYWNKSANNVVTGAYDPSGTLITNPDWIYHSGRGSARAGARSGGCARVRDAWANDIDVGGAPDIVLLHIGINDMLNNSDNDTNGIPTYEYLTNIVTGILRDRPDVKIVMSSPMANAHGHQSQTATRADEPGKTDKNNQFCKPLHEMCLAFYDAVKAETLLSDIPGAKDRLFFADQFLAVEPSWYDDSKLYLNDGSDHCHPNWLGHDIMAETWLAQIKAAFPDPEDKAEEFHSRRVNKGTYLYGAENNVPEEYRKGFKKVRVFNTSLTGEEQLTPGTKVTYDTTDEKTPDSAKVTKVGYYVEYVRETSTTNIHRFVWVDMDAFGDKNVTDAGIPTLKTLQLVVDKLHVYGNHPAVFNIAADNNNEKGFIEFTPYTYGDSKIPAIEGAPAHFAPYDWHDELLSTGAHGCMQVHRILNPADQLRPAQVVFAYNAFTANGGSDQNTVLGIGNFSQSFQSASTDWTNLHQAETCNATAYSVRNIEIWAKVAPVDDSGDAYDTIEEAINEGSSVGGVTEITINTSDPMPIDLTKIEGKSFKLKDASEGTVTWTETATKTEPGKYISYKNGVMTVKEGTFPNVSFVKNGLQAAALGIDVSDETDKPYIKAAAEQTETGKIKFNFFHGRAGAEIAPTGIGGTPVKFKYAVLMANSPTATEWTKPEGAESDTGAVTVGLPQPENDGDSAVRYFKPLFSFE